MALPLKVKAGDPIKASDWNALVDYLRASQILPSKGVRVTRTGMGTILAADVVAGKGGGGSAESPFQGHPSTYPGTGSVPDDQKWKIKVRPGSVNNLIPSNITEEFTLDPSCLTYFWLVATIADGAATSVYIDSGSALPDDQVPAEDSDPTEAYKLLFSVQTNAGGIQYFTPYVKNSLSLYTYVFNYGCGSVTRNLAWYAA